MFGKFGFPSLTVASEFQLKGVDVESWIGEKDVAEA